MRPPIFIDVYLKRDSRKPSVTIPSSINSTFLVLFPSVIIFLPLKYILIFTTPAMSSVKSKASKPMLISTLDK